MTTRQRRVLVAGATGYLGSFVAGEFKRRGFFVRALARSAERLKKLEVDLDDIMLGEVTKPDTIADVCNGMDVVFSSIGITRRKDGLTFRDVDYQGNRNLLDVARRAGVGKFLYTSVFRGPSLLHLDIVKAHENFASVLRASGMDHTILRPNGFFSDMGAYFEMARKGRVYLVGSGKWKVNPIHGADLAEVCVDAVDQDLSEIDVGGPEVLTHREIARLAFRVLDKRERITSVPVAVMKGAVALTRMFNRHQGELLAFFTEAATTDAVAPAAGYRSLARHFRDLATSSTSHSEHGRIPAERNTA